MAPLCYKDIGSLRFRPIVFITVAVGISIYIAIVSIHTPSLRHYLSTSHHDNSGSKPLCNWSVLSVRDTEDDINCCLAPVVSLRKDIDLKINTLQNVTLPLLHNYKNPCWYERLPPTNERLYLPNRQMFAGQANRSFVHMWPLLTERRNAGHPWRLRCLPAFYLLGVAKCGTTDLFSLLIQHPHFTRGALKEAMFWNVNRWVRGATFADYLDMYDEAAEQIRQQTVLLNTTQGQILYHPTITGDFSVSTLFKFPGASKLTNDRTKGPEYTHAHILKNISPGAKVAVLVRNPTERLWSEYLFFNKANTTSPREFHQIATNAVRKMTSCLSRVSWTTKACVYDEHVIWTKKWVRLVAGMYSVFLTDWLSLYPDMMVIRTEDYHQNRTAVYTQLLNILGLDLIIPDEVQSTNMTNKGPTKAFDMMDRTRVMLNKFYEPFNQQLAKMLNDTRFLFKDGDIR